jgi:hypothetical protein
MCACAAAAVVTAAACIPDLPGVATMPPDAQEAPDAPDPDLPSGPYCGDNVIQLDQGEQCDPGPIDPDSSLFGCRSDCTMDCPGGFIWNKNNHCYTLSLSPQASSQCTNAGGHVVTFASEEEIEAVVGNLDAGRFWVGLQQSASTPNQYSAPVPYEPGWAPTCAGCFAHTPDPSEPLPPGPDGGTASQCVEGFSNLDASWRQFPCDGGGRLFVICEHEPSGSTVHYCDAGLCLDIPFTHGQKRYVYMTRRATADLATQECAMQGGSLVVLQSRDEREQLWYEIAASRAPGLLPPTGYALDVWIGLSFSNGAWTWADDAGDDAYPSPWTSTSPTDAGTSAALEYSVSPTLFDTTLAQNAIDPNRPITYLCQISVATDGGDAGDAGPPADASDAGDAAADAPESGDDGGSTE